MASHPEEATDPVPDTHLTTFEHHNRVFQQYAIANDLYHAPIDEEEEERLQIMHDVLSRTFDGRLVFAPINRLRRVLDCGFGCAAWACAVAEQNPSTEVLGVDINPSMQPNEVPENLYLQVDDLNGTLSFPTNNFDLVNSQMLASSIHANRWLHYIRDLLRVTRPGGWCQMVELYFNVQSDNGSLTQDNALSQWSVAYFESLGGLKDLRVPLRLPTLMREAGFVDIEYRVLRKPDNVRLLKQHSCIIHTKQSQGLSVMNPTDVLHFRTSHLCVVIWYVRDVEGVSHTENVDAKEQREYEIGLANRENVQRFLSSLATYPMTEKLGMSIQDVHLMVARARSEADDPALKAYFPLYVCIGRKSRARRR